MEQSFLFEEGECALKRLFVVLIVLLGGFYIFLVPTLEIPHAVVVLFKVIPMILIILYGFMLRGSIKFSWIMAGLTVCTIADAAIAYSFIAGLVIFLIGHLFYIPGFWQARKTDVNRSIPVFLIAVYAVIVGYFLLSALFETGQSEMVLPVAFYILVISVMGIVAAYTRNGWAIVGAILFIISDSILAWNRFVDPIAYSGVWVMTTYYGAQLLIARSRV